MPYLGITSRLPVIRAESRNGESQSTLRDFVENQ
jgi:hypothetical protein